MEGIIKVTPEKLISTAEEFNAINGQVKNITSQMLQTVRSLNSAWEGEAATAYNNQFNKLEDDMMRVHGMINEHANDLKSMAEQYKQAEKANQDVSNSLAGDVIS